MKNTANSLLLSLKTEQDGTGEFTLALQLNGFAGTGCCYVNLQNFLEQAKKFGEFPLRNHEAPCIEGGYFTDDMSALAQTHLKISVVSFGSRKEPKLCVVLSSPTDSEIVSDEAALSCSFHVSYAFLDNLSKTMVAMVGNEGGEYLLDIYR